MGSIGVSPVVKKGPRIQGFEGGPVGLDFAAALGAERRAEERQIRAALPTIRQRFRAFFLRQERELLRRLKAALRKTAGLAAAPWERADQDDAERIARRILLRTTAEQGRLRTLVAEYWPKAVERALRAELKRLGLPAERIDALVSKIMRGRYIRGLLKVKQIKITKIENTTRAWVRRQLVEGLRKGETVSELSSRVHRVLGGNRARALTIARTEAGQAVSAARFTSAAAAGAGGQGWLTGRNPRATHSKAGRDYAPRTRAIALDEPFIVGQDRLMYPRDPNGSPGEIINCNCVMVTVRLKKRQRGSSVELVNAISFQQSAASGQHSEAQEIAA